MSFGAGCSSVNASATIKNNQSIHFGKDEKYRFVKDQTTQSASEIAQEYHVLIKEILTMLKYKKKSGSTVQKFIKLFFIFD